MKETTKLSDTLGSVLTEEFRKFISEFSKNKDSLMFQEFLSDKGNFKIIYKEYVPRFRFHREKCDMEFNATIKDYSSDFIYFICSVLWLTDWLNKNTADKHSENLLRCDMIALDECKDAGLDCNLIVKDAVVYFSRPIIDTDLNKRRVQQLRNYKYKLI